jgi:hypothetical protein
MAHTLEKDKNHIRWLASYLQSTTQTHVNFIMCDDIEAVIEKEQLTIVYYGS